MAPSLATPRWSKLTHPSRKGLRANIHNSDSTLRNTAFDIKVLDSKSKMKSKWWVCADANLDGSVSQTLMENEPLRGDILGAARNSANDSEALSVSGRDP